MIIKKWTVDCKKKTFHDKYRKLEGSLVKFDNECRIKVYLQQRTVILTIIMISCAAYSQKLKSISGFLASQPVHYHHLANFSSPSQIDINSNRSDIDLLSEASFNDVENLDEDDDDDEQYMQSPLDQTSDLEELGKFDESNFSDSVDPPSQSKSTQPNSTNSILSKTEPTFSKERPPIERYGLEVGIRRRNNRSYQQAASQNEEPGLVDGTQCAFFLHRPHTDCITYSMVDWAIERARRRLNFRQTEGISRSVELSESTINSIGEVIELSTAILANRFLLNWREIIYDLEQVDMSRTILWNICPTVYRSPPSCTSLSRYRTHTGQCNNLLGGHVGSSNMPFVRELPPDYGDGIGAPRRSLMAGAELPPVRLIALELHPDIERPSQDFSVLYMAWGQLLNHDMAMASNARGEFIYSYHCE